MRRNGTFDLYDKRSDGEAFSGGILERMGLLLIMPPTGRLARNRGARRCFCVILIFEPRRYPTKRHPDSTSQRHTHQTSTILLWRNRN